MFITAPSGEMRPGDDYVTAAYSAATGAPLWNHATGGSVGSSPAVANGVVYVGTHDGNIHALSAATGAELWRYHAGGYVDSSPAVVNGVVYAGSWKGYLYKFHL